MTNKIAADQPEFLFQNIIIIGLGLIGGSLAQSCKKHQIAQQILGFDIDQNQINFALNKEIIDQQYNFNQKIANGDLIIICSPLFSYEKILHQLVNWIGDQTLIIDVGSLKNFTLPLAEKILLSKAKNFIACHPIAGSEKSGVTNSQSDLFLDKKTIICPNQINDKNALKKIELFWQKIGAQVEFLDAARHDKIFALVSHLPQFLAFIAQEDFENSADEILNQHFRLQNSNPKIWQEIFALNRQNLEYYLQFYLKNIDQYFGDDDDLISRRIALVSCFLNLPDIKEFQPFSGTGFKDFTAIINHSKKSNLKPKSLNQFLHQIKSKITSYEFK
ncbi:MAG: prephenate dehydrogenase/arogenate dehydrogenase family protein [Pseudomonadota bacterium]